MTFRYYDRQTKETAPVDGVSFIFESNGREGYPSSPYRVVILPYFDVSLSAGEGGSLDRESCRVKDGDPLTVTAIPAEGYSFKSWSDGNTDNPRTIVVTSDTALKAEFSVNSYLLKLYLNDELYHSESIGFGAPVVVSAPEVPDGMEFQGWAEEVPDFMPAHDVELHGSYSIRDYVDSITVDSGAEELFDLWGRPFNGSARLNPGIYVRRAGGKTTKIIVK